MPETSTAGIFQVAFIARKMEQTPRAFFQTTFESIGRVCAARHARGELELQGKWRTRACVPHIPYMPATGLATLTTDKRTTLKQRNEINHMSIFKINKIDQTATVPNLTAFKDNHTKERDVQNIIKSNPQILGEDLLIISEELAPCEDSRKRLDLLALDKSGKLVVIELKRNDDGFHMDLQAIRYASMIRLFSIQDVIRHYQDYAQENAQEKITDFLEQEIDKLDFDNIRIILVNQDFSRELTNSVLWLNEQGLDIKCIKITQYEINNDLIWDVDTIIPVKETEEYQLKIKEKKNSDQEIKREFNSRDYTKYTFNDLTDNDKTDLTKGRLVLKVVRKYCEDNPETNFTSLSQIFPKKLQGSNGVLNIFGELKDYQKEGRFYIKDEEIIQLKNGEQIAVCSQWRKDSIEKFIEHVKQTLGYDIVAQ